jgi:hypothetical protein
MEIKCNRQLLIALRSGLLTAAMAAFCLLSAAAPALAQVNPAEVLNPDLKAAETQYFPQLKQLSQSIAKIKFPFSFYLSRYVGLDPAKQGEADSRGLEFVKFHDRIVLKVTGNYNAAYNADQITQNARASRALHEVIVPIASLVRDQIPRDATCDAIGFEISYHARTDTRNYEFEGKEILVVVFEKNDAFAFAEATRDSDRQEILNRSEVYLNGKEYGLSLSGSDPLIVDGLERSSSHKVAVRSTEPPADHSGPGQQINSRLLLGKGPANQAGALAPSAPSAPAAMTQADADKLQAQYQPDLDGLAKQGFAAFHFVDYSPPSFILFQNRIALQITLRNPARFDAEKTSIYKRAAQSFDLFLAPQLKDLVEKAPAQAEFTSFDFTVVNQLAVAPHALSEAMEFVFPVESLRKFIDAGITNQQLIDQSIVLVNGVRIALNLQLVE